MSDSCEIPFHTIFQSTLSGGAFGFPAAPNNNVSARLFVEADAWAHFRIKKLKFRLLCNDTITALLGVGFVGGIQDTPPANTTQLAELLTSTFRGIQQTVPSDWMSVPKKDLAGPLPWYKTVIGSADSTEEAPGAIVLCGSASSAFTLEMRGVFEFKTSVATANTPLYSEFLRFTREKRVAKIDEVERAKLVKVLSPSTAPPVLDVKKLVL
jgi:hypothetical protein